MRQRCRLCFCTGGDSVEALEYAHHLEDRSYYDESGSLRVKYTYDKITVQGKSARAAAINAAVDEAVEAFFGRISAEELKDVADIPLAEGDYFFYTAQSQVTDASDKVFSILVETDWFMGGVRNTDYYGLSFDPTTGEPIDLIGLFAVDEEALTETLKDNAWAYLTAHYGDGLMEDAYDILERYTLQDFLYYFEDGELILTFPTYALGYGYAGAFTVPTGLTVTEEIGE